MQYIFLLKINFNVFKISCISEIRAEGGTCLNLRRYYLQNVPFIENNNVNKNNISNVLLEALNVTFFSLFSTMKLFKLNIYIF